MEPNTNALVEHLRTLLTRPNLTSNTYLAKHIKPNLSLPIYVLAEERKVAQLTSDDQLLLLALQQSGVVRPHSNREVLIIDFPTLKLPTNCPQVYQEIETVLKQHQKPYLFSERGQKQYISLTLFEEDPAFLEQVISSLSRPISTPKAILYDDIKTGAGRAKRLKNDNNNNSNIRTNNTNYRNGSNKYSLTKPPQIFIRKAVDTDEELDHDEERSKNTKPTRKRYREAKESPKDSNGLKETKAKQGNKTVPKQQPMFTNEDFPSLS